MELNVYSSEKFERGKRWYVILAFIMILVIFMCAYYKNWTWIILMFLILWWYIYLWLINVKEIKMKITDEWLILWDKLIPRTNLTWYVIEINKLRVAGELVNDDNRDVKVAMLEKFPTLKSMYSADDDNTQVLYFKNAVATFSSFTEKPEVIKF